MDNLGNPNYNGRNTGEQILQHPLPATFNSYEGSMHEVKAPKLSDAGQQKVKAERKRKADQDYRNRCKKNKDEMTQKLATLGTENEDVKTENQSLKERNALQNQSLQSQAAELNHIRTRLVKLEHENQKQNTLIQILSNNVANPEICLQCKELRDENARLRETAKLSDGGVLQLVKENVKLHHENLLLEVKIDALLGHVVYEKSQNCGQNCSSCLIQSSN